MSTTTSPTLNTGAGATIKNCSRRNFACLSRWQRCDLRAEYRFLRTAYQMAPPQAAGVIRRMASMATWR